MELQGWAMSWYGYSKPSLSDGGIHPWSSSEGYILEQKVAASLMQSHDQAPDEVSRLSIVYYKYFMDYEFLVDIEYVQ